MNRTVFIIIGTIMVFLLLGIWVYVLFFGTPKNNDSDTFANLNFGDTTDTSVNTNNDVETEQPTVELETNEPLRQLTTKPVIGHQEIVQNASSSPEIVYIEAGTGHIYSIGSNSGEETRLSKTTFKGGSAGDITPNGQFVMIQTGSGLSSDFYIGKIDRTNEIVESNKIEENIVSFQATTDNTFLYTIQTNSSVIGVHYYPISDTSETIFTIPFREAVVDWGDNALDTHYTYPKASSKLEGFVFQIKNGDLERLPIDGFGLSAEGNDSMVLFSKQVDGEYETFIYNNDAGLTTPYLFDTIPEKCTNLHNTPTKIICGGEAVPDYNNNYPDVWYRGSVSFADSLREIEIMEYGALGLDSLINIKEEKGREVDIISLKTNQKDSSLYFMNKNDLTLWQYVLDIPIREDDTQ